MPRKKSPLDKIRTLQEKVFQLQSEIADIRLSNYDTCTHEETATFRWESDNGYGRQTEMVGKRCRLCQRYKYYDSGNWT